MDIIFLTAGIGLILASYLDALWTTFWVEKGAGPLSKRLAHWTWIGMKKLIGPGRDAALSIAGPAVLLFSILLWVVLLWAGWTLVFASDETAVVAASTHEIPEWISRIYFVGYSIFTLGNGEYKPNGGAWQLATALMTGSGMFMVTLAITYTLSVVGAVVQKRGFASQVTGIGRTPEEFVIQGWNGHHLRSLDLSLSTIASELSVLTHQYRAYPILQYFHPGSDQDSPVVAVAILDDALTILSQGVPEEIRPNPVVLQSGRSAVAKFLTTMPGAFIGPAPEAPRVPDLQRLRDAGLPTVSIADFICRVEGISERRQKLLGVIRNNAWEWPT